MKIVAMVILILLSGLPVFAGDSVPVFTDKDLEKYKKSSDSIIKHEKKRQT